MRYHFTIIRWAFRLHFLRRLRYRLDLLFWTLTIWLTIGIQAIFLLTVYRASNGIFFGYSGMQVVSFFGMALLANALGQSFSVGITIHLARAVWRGDFDFWLLQPPALFVRIMTEELGFIWYIPQMLFGAGLMLYSLPATLWPLAFFAATVAAVIEAGLVFLLGIPSIRWAKWDPYEGVWEYMQTARSIPIGQNSSTMLWIASFGVLQYSLALHVITNRMAPLILISIAAIIWLIGLSLLSFFVRSYRSASS
jgi:ABC-type uncharacterized transport system permease subunit